MSNPDEEIYFQGGGLAVVGDPCSGKSAQIAVRLNWVTLVNSSSRCISRFPELIGTDSPISNHFQHQYLPQFRNLMETDIIFRPLLTMTSGLFNLTERDSGRPLGYRRDILQKGYIIHEDCAFGLYTSSKSSCLSFTFEILT